MVNWKKFGFKVASKILEAVEEDLVKDTESSWDDTALNLVQMAMLELEKKFAPEVPAIEA